MTALLSLAASGLNSWKKKHRLQFVEDLNECGEKHYLGHFLLKETKKKATPFVNGKLDKIWRLAVLGLSHALAAAD